MKLIEQKSQGSGYYVADKRIDLHYTIAGEWDYIDRYNDLAATQQIVHTDYAFDDVGRFETLKHFKPGTPDTDFAEYAWTYEDSGRVATFDFDAGADTDTITYDYDSAGQLEEADYDVYDTRDEDYGYDTAGNRTRDALGSERP